MQLKKPYLAFIFFILVNIGQTFAQSPEEPEVSETPEMTKTHDKAKPEKSTRIGTGAGYSFVGYREETDLPLNRYMEAINLNFNINSAKDRFCYSLNFEFLSGETEPLEVKNNDDSFSYYQKVHTFTRLFFEHAFDYRLWGNRAFPGYLGSAIRGDFYIATSEQSNYYSFTMLCSFDLHMMQKWIINAGNELVFAVSFPILGYAIRPPYYGLLYGPLDSEGRVTSFENYGAIFGDIKYYHNISKLFSFYLGLGFELSRITFPQQRNDVSLSLNAGIAFSF
jgi:hypothetical protein